MAIHFSSRIEVPAGVNGGEAVNVDQVQNLVDSSLSSNANSRVSLATLMKPIQQVIPAGVLTDGGMTTTAPDTTNMVFVPWNAVDFAGRSKFNQQGQHWLAVPGTSTTAPLAGPTGQGAAVNNTRTITHFTNPTLPSTGIMDINFVTNSNDVVFCMQGYGGRLGVNHVDTDVFIEHQGKMYLTNGGFPQAIDGFSSSPAIYRPMTMNDGTTRTAREWRMLMPSNSAWFQGVWINKGCIFHCAPAKPMAVMEGDSWVEANSVWSSSAGYGVDLGSYQTLGNVSGMVRATGWRWATPAQGGTGWWNANGQDEDPTITLPQNTVFGSQARANDYNSFFKSQVPIMLVYQGSANDAGSGQTRTAHRDRIISGINRYLAYDPTLPILLIGPQAYTDPTPGDNSGMDKNRLGTADAAALITNCIGFIDQMDDFDGTGNQGSPADSSWAWMILPDGLHVDNAGARTIPPSWRDRMCKMTIPTSRLNQCLAVAPAAS
jgi:hypothetical protein